MYHNCTIPSMLMNILRFSAMFLPPHPQALAGARWAPDLYKLLLLSKHRICEPAPAEDRPHLAPRSAGSLSLGSVQPQPQPVSLNGRATCFFATEQQQTMGRATYTPNTVGYLLVQAALNPDAGVSVGCSRVGSPRLNGSDNGDSEHKWDAPEVATRLQPVVNLPHPSASTSAAAQRAHKDAPVCWSQRSFDPDGDDLLEVTEVRSYSPWSGTSLTLSCTAVLGTW